VVRGSGPPAGWAGKVAAMDRGVREAAPGGYVLFTDSDIAHPPDSVLRLVRFAESGRWDLVSLMARLSIGSAAERMIVPAFVFSFFQLYPPAWVAKPGGRTAAAAGGCMLARLGALEAVGGIAAIRRNIIDDVSLARLMKGQGPIWLGLSSRAVSLRPYETLGDIRRMVARSAFAELDYSALKLAGTLAGLILVYLAPPATALFAWGVSQMAGWLACILMVLVIQPILRYYRLSPLWGFALPIIAAFYALFTLDSAWAYWRGRGGMWKGRAQAHHDEPSARSET
jgi:hopene-associated glycosyltransferase HpnB